MPSSLSLLASFVSPALQARIVEHYRVKYTLEPATAAELLSDTLSFLRTAPESRSGRVRTSAGSKARLDRIISLLQGGATIRHVADALKLSMPRVNQILAEARLNGVDVPKLPKGRPNARPQDVSEALRLLRQGYTSREIVHTLKTSTAMLHRMLKLLRARGESVPDPFLVDAWRLKLDRATVDALAAIRKYNGYAELADMLQVPADKQATELEELRVDAKAKARHAKALESEFPPHVVTVPPEPIREEAQKALRKEAVAPTPKEAPNARLRPQPGLSTPYTPTIPAPTPAPVRSLQDILAALNAKATPSTTPNTNP